jgi:hypothetical protein
MSTLENEDRKDDVSYWQSKVGSENQFQIVSGRSVCDLLPEETAAV